MYPGVGNDEDGAGRWCWSGGYENRAKPTLVIFDDEARCQGFLDFYKSGFESSLVLEVADLVSKVAYGCVAGDFLHDRFLHGIFHTQSYGRLNKRACNETDQQQQEGSDDQRVYDVIGKSGTDWLHNVFHFEQDFQQQEHGEPCW